MSWKSNMNWEKYVEICGQERQVGEICEHPALISRLFFVLYRPLPNVLLDLRLLIFGLTPFGRLAVLR